MRAWRFYAFGDMRLDEIVFGIFTKVGDYRVALICAGSLFLPAAIIAWWLPELSD